MLALANYEDSDEEVEEETDKEADKKVTRLDQNGRMVFHQAGWQTEEQREALLRYSLEEHQIEISKKIERPESGENIRRWWNVIYYSLFTHRFFLGLTILFLAPGSVGFTFPMESSTSQRVQPLRRRKLRVRNQK